MAVILFYSPFYKRARDVESVMFHCKKNGHKVFSLNQRSNTEFNLYVRSQDIQVFEHPVKEGSIFSLLNHIIYIIKFCRKNRVDVVFSHLDPPNFAASIAQYFIRGKVYLCRHHVDEAALYNYHRSLSYRLTNFLARKIIVVSQRAQQYMIEVEKVSPGKVIHINLAYDFSLYDLPAKSSVASIRAHYGSGLLAITVCRLTKYKRPDLCIEIVKKLRQEGVPIRLLILGAGPMEAELKSRIADGDLQNDVELIGHVNNPLDYIAASDVMIHPSILESSCVVLKEAGLLRKPVIVCRGIGDADEYIVNEFNGFLLDASSFEQEAVETIKRFFVEGNTIEGMGDRLRESILKNFSIQNVFSDYHKILGNP